MAQSTGGGIRGKGSYERIISPRPLSPSTYSGQERRGKPTTPPPSSAPLLKRGGESRPPRRLRRHPSSREEGKSGEAERRFLLGDELGDPLHREREQRIHLRRGKRRAFGRSLDLDETARARHHHVHVGFAARILGVVQIEDGRALEEADRRGCDEVADGRLSEDAAFEQRPDRIVQGDK